MSLWNYLLFSFTACETFPKITAERARDRSGRLPAQLSTTEVPRGHSCGRVGLQHPPRMWAVPHWTAHRTLLRNSHWWGEGFSWAVWILFESELLISSLLLWDESLDSWWYLLSLKLGPYRWHSFITLIWLQNKMDCSRILGNDRTEKFRQTLNLNFLLVGPN